MKSSFFTSIIVILSLISICLPVFADAPQLLNYQGRLTDTNGNPLNGSHSIQFLIYNDPTAGSTIWSETHGTVNVIDGVYQVLLGSVTPFPSDLFTSSIDRYLEVIIAGETLTPRTRFTSVSYALQTMHSDSADVSATAMPAGPAGGDLASNFPSPRVQAIQGQPVSSTAPATNEVLKWNGSAWEAASDQTGGGSIWQTSGSNIYFDGGNVGIGTNGPSVPLQVVGTIIGSTFSGSGDLLTDLNATNLATGTVPSARFGGTYTNAVTFSSATNSFAGNGAGLTALNATNISSGTIGSTYLPTTLLPSRIIATDYITADGGMHVGGNADPGTDNLLVDGNLGIATTPSYPLHIDPPSTTNIGIYVDFDKSVTGSSIGMTVDIDNTYATSGGGNVMAINAHTTKNNTNDTVWGIYSLADGTTTGSKAGIYGNAGQSGGTGTSYGVFGLTMGGSTRYGVYSTGDLGYTGSLVQVSDRKLKENEKELSGVLPDILKLNPKSYTHSTDTKFEHMNLSKGNHFGLIAQDLEEVFPDLIIDAVHPGKIDEDGNTIGEEIHYKGAKYMELIPILIQGMKEQQEIIEELKLEIEKFKNK